MIALLGITQIALGLTLYGSPKYLFVLYTLVAFTLLMTYLILAYRHQGAFYSSQAGSHYSYSDESGSRRESHHNYGGLAAAGAAGAGLAALAARRHRANSASAVESRRHSAGHSQYSESVHEEKQQHHGGIGKKILEGGAILGALGLAKKFFGKKKEPPPSEYTATEEDESMMTASRPGTYRRNDRGDNGRDDRRSHRDSDTHSYDSVSRTSAGDQHGGRRKLEEAAAGVGIFALAKRFFGKKKKQDDPRAASRQSRSGNLTGDGRRTRPTSFSPGDDEVLNTPPRSHAGRSAAGAGGAMAAGALAGRAAGSHNSPSRSQASHLPPPPLGGAGTGPIPLARGERQHSDYLSSSNARPSTLR